MSTPIKTGSKLNLNLLVDDGNDSLFPLAIVTDKDNVPVVGSPFTLVSIGNGRYFNNDYTVIQNSNYLIATFIVYEDAGHTTEALDYRRDEEKFTLEAQEILDSGTSVEFSYYASMSTVFKDETNTHEILTWLNRGGARLTNTSDCTVRVYRADGVLIWQATQATPSLLGFFRLESSELVLTKDQNFYVIIDIKDDNNIVRSTTLPTVTVG